RMSRWCTVRRSPWSAWAPARLAVLPLHRLSTTATECPSASSRSTSVEPMNPAPPVTRTCTSALLGQAGAVEVGAGPDFITVADDGHAGEHGAFTDAGPGSDHRAVDQHTRVEARAGQDDRVAHHAVLADGRAGHHDGVVDD